LNDGNKRGVIIGVVLVVIIMIIILSVVFFGIKSIGKILIFLVGALLVLAIIGIVIWAIWYLFIKKQKFDATYQNKKRLMEAGKISKPENLSDLYLSGDKGHTRVRIGRITGYCRVKVMRKNIEYNLDGTPKMLRDAENPNKKHSVFTLEEEEQDVFVVNNHGFILSLFLDPMVVRVNPDEHTALVGDVTLFGFSLAPISEYYFLHTDYLDVRKVDFTILKEAERGIFFESLKDTKEIIDKAMGIDSDHKKELEKKNLYEIPQLQQPQQ
jgi:energy-coupling factor transporter transmembrane protein EcfT